MNNATRFTTLACAAAMTLGIGAAVRSSEAEVIELPAADRAALEQHLGKDVVGHAVDAQTITDPSEYCPLRAATLFYRVTNGNAKGQTEEHVWTELKRNPPGSSWSESWGQGAALSLFRADDGSIQLLSADEPGGIKYQFSPPQPYVPRGMRPGDSRESAASVGIFGGAKPNQIIHSASLDLTLTYVGAYRVTVPAGIYDAILLRAHTTGMIDTTEIDDVQYRLLAAGIGTIAEVGNQALGARLDPNDHSRIGRILLAAPQQAPGGAPPAPVAAKPINDRDREARDVIAKFKQKDPGLDRFFREASGWAVFPTIAKGGLIVGGARGDGVVYKNDQLIGYTTVSQGTIGLQVGGQTYSEIIFFEDEAALEHFKSGNAEFSGQVSAVAITAGASADAGYAEGVAVFTMAKGGAMLEASIGGQGFSYTPK